MKKITLLSLCLAFYSVIFCQNVGIGTNTPDTKFTIAGTENTFHGKNAAIKISNISDGGASWYLRSGATGTYTPAGGFSIANDAIYVLNIDNTGNVGIGTTTPAQKLEVNGVGQFSGNTLIGSGIPQGFFGDGGNFAIRAYNTNSSDIYFQTYNGTYTNMIIKNRGDVGIGTQSPSNTLSVNGDVDFSGVLGVGTTVPDRSAKLDVSSTSQGFLPPRMTEAQRNAITPVAGLMIYNTNTNKPNYFNGTVWKNFDGTDAIPLTIGLGYEGGIIAYIFQLGDPGYIDGQIHGLIAAPSDQSIGIPWSNSNSAIGTGTAIGTGNANTNAIVAALGDGNYAARLCYDLVLNGFSDWYLPSKDELNKLYLNSYEIGGFSMFNHYWSSSEFNDTYAWLEYFDIGHQAGSTKSSVFYVRAIRTF